MLSAREWDFTPKLVCWHCTFAQLRTSEGRLGITHLSQPYFEFRTQPKFHVRSHASRTEIISSTTYIQTISKALSIRMHWWLMSLSVQASRACASFNELPVYYAAMGRELVCAKIFRICWKTVCRLTAARQGGNHKQFPQAGSCMANDISKMSGRFF